MPDIPSKATILKYLLLCFLSLILPLSTVGATPETVRWFRVDIPTEGQAGNWVLASGSDVQHLVGAIDGTLYAYGKGLTYTLYKSTDGGQRWSRTGNVQHNIAAIATAPDDAGVLYYATTSAIYKSTDAGNSFTALLPNPGGAGSNNVEITSIAIARAGESYVIAAATRDTDAGQYGGVYLLDESQVLPAWQDTAIGSYDVYYVAFSPGFPLDRQLIAVATDETDTIVMNKLSNGGWGQTLGNAALNRDNTSPPTPVAATATAAIAFPTGYSATGEVALYIAIDTGIGNGDVYRVGWQEAASSAATDLNIGSAYNLDNIDVTSLAVTGSGTQTNLMAGTASGTDVYYTTDAGLNWTKSTRQPTGGSGTYVMMAADYETSKTAYAATTGTESAFSRTIDGGLTWNQLSLIDTAVTALIDLAVSPDYSHDNTLFLLTFGGKHSLWRSQNGGMNWERAYSSALPDIDQIKQVKLPPRYDSQNQTVFITATKGSNWFVGKATDNGQDFTLRAAFDPEAATIPINAWTVLDENTLFVASFNGSNGLVYRTDNSGYIYSTGKIVSTVALNSIALSPNYSQDRTILVGNSNG